LLSEGGGGSGGEEESGEETAAEERVHGFGGMWGGDGKGGGCEAPVGTAVARSIWPISQFAPRPRGRMRY
jgi:hypothetical protein